MRRGPTSTAVAAGLLLALAACGTENPGRVDGEGPEAGARETLYGTSPTLPQEARQALDTLAESQRSALASKDTLTPAEQAILDHYRADRGPEQPIPFNHEWHAGELQMSCEYCHTGSDRSEAAIMPSVSTCMGCHRIAGGDLPAVAQLRTYNDQNATIPWVRVYKMPEFVQFAHQPHLRNDIACQECHGPVEEMARVYQATDMTMGWCLECHRSEPQQNDVATTYRLIRQDPPHPIPQGTQSRGLYPVQIDQEYGETRAPIDCAACHY